MSSFPIPGFTQQSSGLNGVNAAHQQITAKLGAINTLKAQKKASNQEQERAALQTLIDLRVAEVPALISAYSSAVNTFISVVSGPTGPTS